jgi:hypothetical protein
MRPVFDHLVVPGIDPHEPPAPESLPTALAGWVGLAVLVLGLAAVMFGLA